MHLLKIVMPENISSLCCRLREEGKTIATLNGSFDLLHAGHLYMIQEAKKQADCVIMSLNSDLSIQQYKSQDRPIIPLKERQELVAALMYVDYVTAFDEVDPREWLRKVHPDVHVNGEEYGSDCIEKEVLDQIGARLHLVKRIPGLATSEIIAKIQGLCVS